jgi:hypothetical protein
MLSVPAPLTPRSPRLILIRRSNARQPTKKPGDLARLRKLNFVRVYTHFTTSVPFMSATWPGKEQMNGYSPAAGALKVTSAVSFGPSTLTNATT